VREQVDLKKYEPLRLHEDKVEDWLADNLKKGDRVAYDPWLHTKGWAESAQQRLSKEGIELVAMDKNPIDQIWTDQPAPSKIPAKAHDLKYAGEASEHKRQRIGHEIKAAGADAVVLTSLDSIAWLFNIRGEDVDCTPLTLAFAMLHASGQAVLYIDPDKATDELKEHLGQDVSILAKDNFLADLQKTAKAGKAIMVDAARAHAAIFNALKDVNATVIEADDPCILAKASKNHAELDGARTAHVRDGVALCRFLAWLDRTAPGKITELSAAEKLLSFRKQQELFQQPSFATISGAGPNGAVVHYGVSEESSRDFENNMMYLVDSGGQYLDGTTDVTRTIIVGEPTEEQKDRFTRVLKGHIALAQAHFPKGIAGGHLDALARKSLWDIGLDYAHGTGHGVGSYLGVHEGPQNISRAGTKVPLQEGMILSNEPGYYKSGEYGIRIENLVIVRESSMSKPETPMLSFETITFAPIDRRLVNAHMMTSAEITWLNIYHATVKEKIAPFLTGDDLKWLEQATESVIVV